MYNNFKHLLKATKPIVTKFHFEPQGMEETKICSNLPCHMSSMATMPIYIKSVKNLLLQNGLETVVCYIEYSSTTTIVQTMTWVVHDFY